MEQRLIFSVVGGSALAVLISLGAAWAMVSQQEQRAQDMLKQQAEQVVLLKARVDVLEQKLRLEPQDATRPMALRAGERREQAPQGLPSTLAEDQRGLPPHPQAAAEPLAQLGEPEADPRVRQAVQGLIRDELEIERQERELRRNERMKERTREEIAEFAKAHNLDSRSEELLLEQVNAEREQIRDLWRSMRDGDAKPEDMREQMTQIRAKTETEAESILEKEQFDAFKKQRQEEVERFMNRGRGGGGGRGGWQRQGATDNARPQ